MNKIKYLIGGCVFLVFIIISVFINSLINTQNQNVLKKDLTTIKQRDDYYHIISNVYSQYINPMIYKSNKKVSIKEFLSTSNCMASCLYDDAFYVTEANDGGSVVYHYNVNDLDYYIIQCHKFDKNKPGGYNTDILIGDNWNKLIETC